MISKKNCLRLLVAAFVVGGLSLSMMENTYAHGGHGHGGRGGGCYYQSDCPYYGNNYNR